MASEKKIYRIPPCPAYDIAGTESWLEDMALEGLYPVKMDHPVNCVSFRPDAANAVRYRLEPAPKNRSIFDHDDTPPQDLQELSREYGWEFLCRYDSFYVYRSANPDAREMNTDPEVHAMALTMLKKQWLRSLIFNLIYAALLFFILIPGFFQHMVTYGSVMIVFFLELTGLLLRQLLSLIQIHRLYRSLSAGSAMGHRRDWRKGAKPFRGLQLGQYVILVLLVIGLFHVWMVNFDFYSRDLADYSGSPPFVTLDELTPENQGVSINHIDNGTFSQRIDPLIPMTLTWLDGGQVNYTDGTWTAGLLEVQYCEAAFPWLAKAIAKDYLDFQRHRHEADAVSLPAPGLDYAWGYYDVYAEQQSLSRVALVKGNVVICARFSMLDQHGSFTLENWTAMTMQRLMAAS